MDERVTRRGSLLRLAGLVGGALGPLIVGALSDALTPQLGAEGLRQALAAMIASPLVATVFLVAAFRRAPGAPAGRAQPA
jgi:MFS family permease